MHKVDFIYTRKTFLCLEDLLLQTKWNTSFPQQASSTSVMPNSEFKTHLEYKSNKPDRSE